jgi:hypothetical protein
VSTLASRLEYSTADDPARNYCLWDYVSAVPAEDKLRAVNLLLQSFDVAGVLEPGASLIDAVRDAIGPFRTVFGIKDDGERLSWEFYFYDYERRARQVGANRVLDAAHAFFRCPVRIDESLPYFMFSLDVDVPLLTGKRDLDVVHAYVGNPGSTVSSGICYAMTRESRTLENFYFFFDAVEHRQEAADKIRSSVHFDDTRADIDTVLLPQLRDCQTICVANKRTHDCVYFSGVDVAQLIWFLDRFRYPAAIREFVSARRSLLDHLLFDVGIDYCADGDGIRVLKTGYFGVF